MTIEVVQHADSRRNQHLQLLHKRPSIDSLTFPSNDSQESSIVKVSTHHPIPHRELIDGVDFVGSIDSVKALFRLPYTTEGVTIALHKLGKLLVIDGQLNEIYETPRTSPRNASSSAASDSIPFSPSTTPVSPPPSPASSPSPTGPLSPARPFHRPEHQQQHQYRAHLSDSHLQTHPHQTTDLTPPSIEHDTASQGFSSSSSEAGTLLEDKDVLPRDEADSEHEAYRGIGKGLGEGDVMMSRGQLEGERACVRRESFSELTGELEEEKNRKRQMEECLVAPGTFSHPPPPFSLPPIPRSYPNLLHFELRGIQMLMGHERRVFSNPEHRAVSAVFTEAEQGLEFVTCLDAYLENVFANIPELAICMTSKGYVRSCGLIRTEDIPMLNTGSAGPFAPTASRGPLFDPKDIDLNAATLLRFLKENCNSEGSTYLLHRDAGGKTVELYDVTALSAQRRRRWIWLLAMLSYRFAMRIYQQAPLFGRKMRLQLTFRHRRLLQTCLSLLQELNRMVERGEGEEAEDVHQGHSAANSDGESDISHGREAQGRIEVDQALRRGHESLCASVQEQLADSYLRSGGAQGGKDKQEDLNRAEKHLGRGIGILRPLLPGENLTPESSRERESVLATYVPSPQYGRQKDLAVDAAEAELWQIEAAPSSSPARSQSPLTGEQRHPPRSAPTLADLMLSEQIFGMREKLTNTLLWSARLHMGRNQVTAALCVVRRLAEELQDTAILANRLEQGRVCGQADSRSPSLSSGSPRRADSSRAFGMLEEPRSATPGIEAGSHIHLRWIEDSQKELYMILAEIGKRCMLKWRQAGQDDKQGGSTAAPAEILEVMAWVDKKLHQSVEHWTSEAEHLGIVEMKVMQRLRELQAAPIQQLERLYLRASISDSLKLEKPTYAQSLKIDEDDHIAGTPGQSISNQPTQKSENQLKLLQVGIALACARAVGLREVDIKGEAEARDKMKNVGLDDVKEGQQSSRKSASLLQGKTTCRESLRRLGDACNELGGSLSEAMVSQILGNIGRGIRNIEQSTDADQQKESPDNRSELREDLSAMQRAGSWWSETGRLIFLVLGDRANVACCCLNEVGLAKLAFKAGLPFEVQGVGASGNGSSESPSKEAAGEAWLTERAMGACRVAHEVLAEREVDTRTWDAVRGEMAMIWMMLGLGRKERVRQGGKIVRDAEDQCIIEPLEQAFSLYQELGMNKQVAACAYSLGEWYASIWTRSSGKVTARRRLKAALGWYEKAFGWFVQQTEESSDPRQLAVISRIVSDLCSLFLALESILAERGGNAAREVCLRHCVDVILRARKWIASSEQEMVADVVGKMERSIRALMALCKIGPSQVLYRRMYRRIVESKVSSECTELLLDALEDLYRG